LSSCTPSSFHLAEWTITTFQVTWEGAISIAVAWGVYTRLNGVICKTLWSLFYTCLYHRKLVTGCRGLFVCNCYGGEVRDEMGIAFSTRGRAQPEQRGRALLHWPLRGQHGAMHCSGSD
jgi:hypothetical protein